MVAGFEKQHRDAGPRTPRQIEHHHILSLEAASEARPLSAG
jgi:hypothetical protein